MDTYVMLADSPFYTIQGEGPSIGQPAVFFRVAGCPVGCSWCDTKYSWPRKGVHVGEAEIVSFVEATKPRVIVITGGEPVAPESIRDAYAVAAIVPQGGDSDEDFIPIEIETSGYRFEERITRFASQINLSPKIMPSAGVAPQFKMSETTATEWLAREEESAGELNLVWKFPIGSEEDLDVVLGFVDSLKIDRQWVWLMPEGMTPDELAKKSRWLVEHCKTERVNFTPRLHVDLWGPRRGV